MSYQRVTGALTPGAHPGSYNGQDAYNDMLVVSNGAMHRQRTSESADGRTGRCAELYARSAIPVGRGGGVTR